jgi:predicted nucleic acid-binding Zn ribbon protein
MREKFCVVCNKPLEGRQTKVCSLGCRQVRAYSPPKTRERIPCKCCGETFTQRHRSKMYCSDRCRGAQVAEKLPENLPPKICATCGKEFFPPHRIRKYCKPLCRNIARAKRVKAKNKKDETEKT